MDRQPDRAQDTMHLFLLFAQVVAVRFDFYRCHSVLPCLPLSIDKKVRPSASDNWPTSFCQSIGYLRFECVHAALADKRRCTRCSTLSGSSIETDRRFFFVPGRVIVRTPCALYSRVSPE